MQTANYDIKAVAGSIFINPATLQDLEREALLKWYQMKIIP